MSQKIVPTKKSAPAKKAVRRSRALKPVPDDAFNNHQLGLFQGLYGEREELSNAIDLWDSVPRYSMSRVKMNSLRTSEGFLETAEVAFNYRGNPWSAMIQPARIDQGGKKLSFYPSAREELIEHALRKIAADQQVGFFDRPDFRSGARFSLHQLRKELEQQGHSLRYDELIQGLQILSRSIIVIDGVNDEGKPVHLESPYLPALAGVTRSDLNADPNAKWIAQFHGLVTDSINRLTYRQFNYRRLMNCRTQLARWLIGQLVLKYVQAAITNSFDMYASTIRRDSSLLNGYKRERDAIAALDEAWEELKAQGAISTLNKVEKRGARGKLLDVVYTVYPSREFAAEQKAANRRLMDGKATTAAIENPVARPAIASN